MEVKAPIHVASSNGVEFLNTLNELLKSQDLSLNIANSEGMLAIPFFYYQTADHK